MTTVEFPHYNLFQYEKTLAARELQALITHADPLGLEPSDLVRGRATYFQFVDGVPTVQALTEGLHHSERGSRVSRQATRYLVHGLHEYKGKFNPQMARALINAVDPSATALMDPYCGSGTTLVEAMRLGLAVSGIDQNPLAVWITSVKMRTLRLAGTRGLVERFDALVARLVNGMARAQLEGEVTTPATFAEADYAYLRRWLPDRVIDALWEGICICRNTQDPVAEVAELCISNIVREVSWQLPEDLRVRRRPGSWVPPHVAGVLARSVQRARLALAEIERAPHMDEQFAEVHQGSSRDASLVSKAWADGRRLVVTSPPYATALPYIDTDRLSIVLFGLAPVRELRELDEELTGSREWRSSVAAYWAQARHANTAHLPTRILDVLDCIEATNKVTGAGFRRRAVPVLLYRYFTQVGQTLDALAGTMRPGEHVVMVVGSNRTGSGLHQITIPTPELLGLLSETRGFEYTERIALETWSRYGMHAKNAVNTEDAVLMTVKA